MSSSFSGTNFVALEKSLISWIQGIVGANVPIISLYSNSTRPTSTYLTFYLNKIEQKGIDYVPTDDTLYNVGNYEVWCSLMACSQSAALCYQLMQAIRQGVYQEANYPLLQAQGIAFFRMEGMHDVSAQVGGADTIFERRVESQLIFGTGNIYNDNVGQISTVNGTATYLDPAGSIIAQEPFSAG